MDTIRNLYEDPGHAEEILHERSVSIANSLRLAKGVSVANLAIAATMSNLALGSTCATLVAMSTKDGTLVKNGSDKEASFTQF